jgi:hypothetical protein
LDIGRNSSQIDLDEAAMTLRRYVTSPPNSKRFSATTT